MGTVGAAIFIAPVTVPSTTRFGAAIPWDAYFTSLEILTPKMEAISVPIYYSPKTYEGISEAAIGLPLGPTLKASIGPNIELRS